MVSFYVCERMLGMKVQKPPRKSWFAELIRMRTTISFYYGENQKIQLLVPHFHDKFYSRMERIERVEKIFKTGERSRKGDVVDISVIKIKFDG